MGKRRPLALKGDRFGDLGKGTRSLSRRLPKWATGLHSEFLDVGFEALSLPEAAIKGARGFRFSSEAKCAGRRSERAVANFRDTSPIGKRAVVGRAFRRSFCVPRFVPRSAEVLFGCLFAPRENFENPIFPIFAKRKSEKGNKRRAKGQAINRDRGGAGVRFVFFARMSGAGAPPFSAVWAIGAAPPAVWVADAAPWPFASGEAGGARHPNRRARAIPPPIPFGKFFRRGAPDRRRGCETRARASAYLRAMRRWQWHAEAARLGARVAALEACPPAPFEAVGNGNFSEAMQALQGWAAACFDWWRRAVGRRGRRRVLA
ncbi:hypothetical protein ERJ75_001708100 [Trypanosoma vivax]|nr:hypothetical protein ERJ75_001708100 [Trypanosoma vivax]